MHRDGSSDTHLSGCVSPWTVRTGVPCQVKVGGSGQNAYTVSVLIACTVFVEFLRSVCVCGVKDGESERASYTHPNGRSSLTGGPGQGGEGGEDVPQRDTIGD